MHESGRFFVALSLAEAEAVRGCTMLLSEDGAGSASSNAACVTLPAATRAGLEGASWALRPLFTYRPKQRGETLSATANWRPAGEYQTSAAVHGFRFFNGGSAFNARAANIVVRGLAHAATVQRERWWNKTRRARRRRRVEARSMPTLQRIFTHESELHLLTRRALAARITHSLASQNLSLVDFFTAVDHDSDATLAIEELNGGLRHLGITVADDQIRDLFDSLDGDGDATITFAELAAVLELADDGEGVAVLDVGANVGGEGEGGPESDNEAVSQMFSPTTAAAVHRKLEHAKSGSYRLNIAPVALESDAGALALRLAKTAAALRKVRALCGSIEVCTYAARAIFAGFQWSKVWDSRGTMSRKSCTVWRPWRTGTDPSYCARNERSGYIVLSHFATAELDAEPREAKLVYVERGAAHANYMDAVDMMFPHPVGFRKIWSQSASDSGKDPLFVWEPIPPMEPLEGGVGLRLVFAVSSAAQRLGVWSSAYQFNDELSVAVLSQQPRFFS